MTEFVCIKKFGDRHDADVAKSVLDASGISSFIQSDDAGGMYPFMTEQIRLLIKKTDIDRAKKILK